MLVRKISFPQKEVQTQISPLQASRKQGRCSLCEATSWSENRRRLEGGGGGETSTRKVTTILTHLWIVIRVDEVDMIGKPADPESENDKSEHFHHLERKRV